MIKILVVRRDNIGDLICTLPLLASLRQKYPAGRIDLLVNSYNAPVVKRNDNIDNVYIYTKAKHRESAQSVLATYWYRLCLTIKMLAQRYDYVVLANVGQMSRPMRWAQLIRPRNVVGFAEPGKVRPKILNCPVLLDRKEKLHEIEYVMQLMQPFGGAENISSPVIYAESSAYARAKSKIDHSDNKRIIGFNLSARLPSQQWAIDNWVALIREFAKTCRCVIFWSPGSINNPRHPGDDEKADAVLSDLKGLEVIGFKSTNLDDLIAGMSSLDGLITADGGAMHIGAACGKPVVALFGDSDPVQWHPWGVPHVVLQKPGRNVNLISVSDVIEAAACLGFQQSKSMYKAIRH